jgi:hypothetical protein
VRLRRPVAFDEQPALAPRVEHGAQAAGLGGHALVDPLQGHAIAEPEAEDETLGQALARRQDLVVPTGRCPARP